MSDNFSEKTIGYQLNKGAQMLETAGIDNARAEVRFLLSEVTNLTPVVLHALQETAQEASNALSAAIYHRQDLFYGYEIHLQREGPDPQK